MDFQWIFEEPHDYAVRNIARHERNDQRLRRMALDLERENAQLRLSLAAVIRLLLQKGTFTLPELVAITDDVDREDGIVDGQLRDRPLPGQRTPGRRKPTVAAKQPQPGKGQPLPKPPASLKKKTDK